jgi:hypothetical protein
MVQRENEIGVDSHIFKIVWEFQTLHTAGYSWSKFNKKNHDLWVILGDYQEDS